MADYTVDAGDLGVRGKTLVADTVDTVSFTANLGGLSDGERGGVFEVLVATADGDNDIWVTVDGTTPEVNGATSHRLIGSRGAALRLASTRGDEVKLLSEGTPTYDATWTEG